jgi:hypothetical protein
MIPKMKQLESDYFAISVTKDYFQYAYEFGRKDDNAVYPFDSKISIVYDKNDESFVLYSSQIEDKEEVVFLTPNIAYWTFDNMHGDSKIEIWLFNYEGHAVMIHCEGLPILYSFEDISQYFDFEQYIVDDNGASKISSIDLSQLK